MQEIEKLISLMTFIKEMHKLNTPLQRRITTPFVDINLLKELENNELVIVKLDGSLNEDGAFLHIRKPTFTACPSPDDKIQPWLIKGWDDYRSEVYVKEKLTTIGDDGFEIELVLSEIEEVSELIDKWVNIRSEWSIRENEKYRIQTLSDEICVAHGLEILKPYEKSKQKPISAREYRAAARGNSWKFKLMAAIDGAMVQSRSKAEFIAYMERLGYKVKWEPHHKYITYTTPDGKPCRDNKLHETKYLKKIHDLSSDYDMSL